VGKTIAHPIKPPPPVAVPPEQPLVLYNSWGVAIATFFGTPLAGSILLSVNYRRMKNAGAAWKAMGAGVALTVALLLWTLFGPSGEGQQAIATVVGISLSIAFRVSAKQLQGKAVEENQARGGKRASYWAAFGIGLLTLAAAFVLAVVMLLVRDAGKTSVVIGS
jgi:hypothetical protein